MSTAVYNVPGMTCDHCRAAVTTEISKVAGVDSVDVDLESKLVTVSGPSVDDTAIRDAIDDAGFDVA